jgi:hypothetical protein
VDQAFRDLDASPSWWRLGFDGKALLEALVGSVVGLIALFPPMTTSTSPTASSLSSSNGASGSSLPPFRSFLQMLNWRRDPAREMQIERSKERTKQLKNERVQIEKDIEQLRRDNALLSWMHSEIDLIEADLPSSSTPPPTSAANSCDC